MARQRGTCPACFREMDVVGGRMGRHGWTESGGRRVGQQGCAWHSGACFGHGYRPFEVSPEGTIAFLERILFPAALHLISRLTYLATRPELTVEYVFDTGEYQPGSYRTVPETRTATIQPGQKLKVSLRDGDRYAHWTREFDYEQVLTSNVRAVELQRNAIMDEGNRLSIALGYWEPRPLKKKEAKVPVTHARVPGKWFTYCRSRAMSPRIAENPHEATCHRCRKYLPKCQNPASVDVNSSAQK